MTEIAPINIGTPEYKMKETDYFSWFALAHHSALKPHYLKGEILKKDQIGDWKAVQHCLAAGSYADLIIDLLNESGSPQYQIDNEMKKKIVDAAILHDWHKKKEVQITNTARQAGNYSYETINIIKEQDSAELREMGFAEDIIELTGANVPETKEGPAEFPEQIIWYVDAMLSITDAVPIGQRFDDLDRGWTGEKEDPVRAAHSKAFSEMFAPKYDETPLFDVQRGIATRLNNEFAQALQYEGNPDDLPLHFKKMLHERIENFQHPHKSIK